MTDPDDRLRQAAYRAHAVLDTLADRVPELAAVPDVAAARDELADALGIARTTATTRRNP